MKNKKYFDCSINVYSNRIHGKNSYGPIENDIMRDLSKYSNLYGFERIYEYDKADIIITNTIYPNNILEWSKSNNISLIKRMDGIYWQNELKYKNILLNNAAIQSDMVIFISEYSKNTLHSLYDIQLKNSTVILNNIDDITYHKRNKKNENFTFVSSATNWLRDGKRLNSIIELSKILDKNDIIKLIGHCDIELPNNIIKCGYIDNDDDMSNIIGTSDAFISLFFRDAGSKVTCQGVQCGLPILHTSSGGLMELVDKQNGVMITDYNDMNFLDETPNLNIDIINDGYKKFKISYSDILYNYQKNISYQETISNYFNILKDFC